MKTDPVEDAKDLLVELKDAENLPLNANVAASILLRPKSKECIERLIRYLEGYTAGVERDAARISAVATKLLLEIAKLRDAKLTRSRLGLPSTGRTPADDFIDGTAPRLWELADQLREILEQ